MRVSLKEIRGRQIVETAQAVSVHEYLNTSYESDPELIDGQLKEKSMPTDLHSFVQAMIVHWFATHMREWQIMPLPEVRTQVTSFNFRLPDVAVVRRRLLRGKPQENPPLIAIEILSPDDKFSDLRNRALDFARMGVEHIWLVDPQEQVAFHWGGREEKSWVPTERLAAAGTPIYLDLDWVWNMIPQD